MAAIHHHNPAVNIEKLQTNNGNHDLDKPPYPDVEHARRIAKALSVDIVNYVCGNNKKMPNRYARTLRRTVDELTQRHYILFNGMVHKLNLDEETGYRTFTNIINEMFSDKHYNWGRIVAVYAFAARLAKYCVDENMNDYCPQIATYLGDYVAEHLAEWISEHGGWVSNVGESIPFTIHCWKSLLKCLCFR